MISKLKNPDVIEFIQENLNEDPSVIALKASKYPDLPIREIATQIASRQKARKKLKEWFENEHVIFPPKENLEQASSQETAQFKASRYSGDYFLDLTGGTGIDTYYISKRFKKSSYVEPISDLCKIAKHNFDELGAKIQILEMKAEEFIQNTNEQFDLIYIDPSRRSESKQRVVNLEDYQPNVRSILPLLLKKSERVLIKVSPMVDVKQTINQLESVSRVTCLAVRNEMKEVLFELKQGFDEDVQVEAINLKNESRETFEATFNEERIAINNIHPPRGFIYEPNSAIRKAGFFKIIGTKFNLEKLDHHTHLYTSDQLIEDFPGRILKVENQFKPDKKLIKKHVPNKIINVISKNYPLNATEIKKKYQIKDGGNNFLIFCSSVSFGNICLQCQLFSSQFTIEIHCQSELYGYRFTGEEHEL